MKSRFQINGSFQVTGRGLVATGEILSGRIKVGDVMDVEIENVLQRLRIAAVDFVDNLKTKEHFVGLGLKSDLNLNLNGVKLKPQTVDVLPG